MVRLRTNWKEWDADKPAHALLVVAAVVAFALVGPLRGLLLPSATLVTFAATLTLFLIPGMVLALTLPREHFSGLSRVPAAFVFSAGIFGVLGVPVLVLHRSPELYLWLAGTVVVAATVVAAVIALGGGAQAETRAGSAGWSSEDLLWIPFGLLVAIQAYASPLVVEGPSYDHWFYLAYVREWLNTDQLATYSPFFDLVEGGSRIGFNGWMLEQVALSKVSGADPADLLSTYLPPALIVVAALGLYTMARVLFESRPAALLTGALSTLYLIVDLDSLYESTGSALVARVVEDKLLAWFVFLPVALALAVLFVGSRRLWHLVLFTLVCWSVVAVHPLGLVFIGIPVTGFGLVHLALGWRHRETWTSLSGLAVAMLSIGVPPTAYLLATGSPLLSRLASQTEGKASSLLDSGEESRQLLALGDATYIVHPALLLEPIVLAAYVVGVPFLLWRVKNHLAARLLLGTLLIVPLLVFLPPVTSLLGPILGPWTLPRLSWSLLFPVSFLTVGWAIWEALRYSSDRLADFAPVARARPLLPLVLLVAVAAVSAPSALNGVRSADASNEALQERITCQDPAFPRMRQIITRQSTILAPNYENSCIAAYVAPADFMQLRALDVIGDTPTTELDSVESDQVPLYVLEAQKFMASPALDEGMLQVLREYDVGHVLLPTNSPLNEQLGHLPGFDALDLPGERYRLYRVDSGDLEPTPVVEANGYLNDGEWERAVEAYSGIPAQSADEQFLAYLGLGQALTELGRHEEAVSTLETATRLFPKEPGPYVQVARAHDAAGDVAAARVAQKRAVLRAPQNVEVRLGLVRLLQEMEKERKLAEQHREIVEAFPQVPEYRVRLGGALVLTKDYEAADEEFRGAERLNPRSAKLFELMGNANKPSGRLEETLAFYERALELDPGNPQYSLQVGLMHARISIRDDDAGYAEQAEKELEQATNAPLSQKQKGTAWFVLGKLYESRARPGEAEKAYRNALKATPDSAPAKESLTRLQQGGQSGSGNG